MLVDSNLPVDRDRLKNRLIRLVKEDNEILACYFGGSVGEGTEDFYSDLDARIVVQPDVSLVRKQQEIIRSIGEYLFVETFEETYSVIHYATFIKLDLFVYKLEMLEPNIWMKHIDIVKDDGTLATLREASAELEYAPNQDVFDTILNKYYGFYFELYRSLKRDEPNHVESTTLAMKQSLISMWYLSKGFVPNPVLEWSKYEGHKSKLSHLEKEFILSYTPCLMEDLEVFTKKIELLMLEAAEKVATYHGLTFSPSHFRKIHRRISFKDEMLEEEEELL